MERAIGSIDVDLVKVIRACKEAGVLRFKMEGVDIIFAPIHEIMSAQVQTESDYGIIEERLGRQRHQQREIDGDDEADVKQQVMEELLLTDPAAYEELQSDDNIDRTILTRDDDR